MADEISKEESLEKPAKIQKLTDDSAVRVDSVCATLESFKGFTFKRLLKENPENRLVAIEGTFEEVDSSSAAVVVLEKTHFTDGDIQGILTGSTSLQQLFHNDVYGNFLCFPPTQLNSIKATVIHPATGKHIDKFTARESHLIEETPSVYKSVTLPHIQESQLDFQWVYNILDHKKEFDRIVFEDPDPEKGFILLPDLKWDCRTNSNLYLSGIVRKRGIKSLRDLTGEHLPLLNNLLEKGSAAISEKYGLPRSQLRIFVHYQPSYYHLHVHFTSLQFNPPGCNVERAHLLSTVIRNIELKSSYYQDTPLSFLAFEGDALLTKYRRHLANKSNGGDARQDS